MTLDLWLTEHPYLQPLADLQAQVQSAVNEALSATAPIPQWELYREEFRSGVPLLWSSRIGLDLGLAEEILRACVQNLCSRSLPRNLAKESRTLCAELCRGPDSPRKAIGWLLGEDSFGPTHPGLLQYLGWTMLSRYLDPVLTTFREWREEEAWLRAYCPTCGSPPAMAQLVGVDPGRHRFLVCGRCRTNWRFRRLGCASCENEDDTQLCVIGLEQEDGLRVDYCRACGGYLKTYSAEGSEAVMLADWTSLHLDVLACDRGLRRIAGSLYEMRRSHPVSGVRLRNPGEAERGSAMKPDRIPD